MKDTELKLAGSGSNKTQDFRFILFFYTKRHHSPYFVHLRADLLLQHLHRTAVLWVWCNIEQAATLAPHRPRVQVIGGHRPRHILQGQGHSLALCKYFQKCSSAQNKMSKIGSEINKRMWHSKISSKTYFSIFKKNKFNSLLNNHNILYKKKNFKKQKNL